MGGGAHGRRNPSPACDGLRFAPPILRGVHCARAEEGRQSGEDTSENLFALIERRATRRDRVFIALPEARGWTYGDALAMSGRIANLLIARGLKPGDRVALQVEKSPQAVMLYLGRLRAGAVYRVSRHGMGCSASVAGVVLQPPRRGGRVVLQRPAKPCTPVRFRPPPPLNQ